VNSPSRNIGYHACAEHTTPGDVLVKPAGGTWTCGKCEDERRVYAAMWWSSVTIPEHVPDWKRFGYCCAEAEQVPCVCIRSCECPVHGRTCRGSHD